jgi:hypothetical protein
MRESNLCSETKEAGGVMIADAIDRLVKARSAHTDPSFYDETLSRR